MKVQQCLCYVCRVWYGAKGAMACGVFVHWEYANRKRSRARCVLRKHVFAPNVQHVNETDTASSKRLLA